MSKVADKLVVILKEKKTRITQAIFWKILHHDESKKDVRLKVGRYVKPQDFQGIEGLESLEPKSELTFDNEEFEALIKLLQDNYEPFKQGFKNYIPLDEPLTAENAEAIKIIFNQPDITTVMNFISEHKLIRKELELALQNARRTEAIDT